jgi:hypothetical protein
VSSAANAAVVMNPTAKMPAKPVFQICTRMVLGPPVKAPSVATGEPACRSPASHGWSDLGGDDAILAKALR